MSRNVALVAMVVAGAAWGAVFVAPGLAPLAPALLLATGRFVAFGAVSLPQVRRVLRAGVPWGRVIAHALTGSVLYHALVALSVRLAGPTVAVATIGLVPVVMALVSARGTGRIASLVPALALVGVGQVLLHIGPGQDWSLSALVGLGLAVLALISWSWYGLDSHELLRERPDVAPVLAAAQGLAAGALALPAAVVLVLIDGVPAQPLRRSPSCCSSGWCPRGSRCGSGTARPVISRRYWSASSWHWRRRGGSCSPRSSRAGCRVRSRWRGRWRSSGA